MLIPKLLAQDIIKLGQMDQKIRRRNKQTIYIINKFLAKKIIQIENLKIKF